MTGAGVLATGAAAGGAGCTTGAGGVDGCAALAARAASTRTDVLTTCFRGWTAGMAGSGAAATERFATMAVLLTPGSVPGAAEICGTVTATAGASGGGVGTAVTGSGVISTGAGKAAPGASALCASSGVDDVARTAAIAVMPG